ncbi:MAG: hypothetical protein XXXJIFNMEKO3_01283 [Candidatus Erwinia impunctatus]|nr:hypothetical protein XXXJIFNMEKO_01283 [Culicoides impunctatus]
MKALKSLLLVSIFALTACGSSGGGGNSSSGEVNKEQTVEPVKPTTPTTPAAPQAGGASKGTISGYTYTAPNGVVYALKNNIIQSAGMTTMKDKNGTLATCCGRMSYTTYGTWASGTDNAVFHATDKATAVANVPTEGKATYTGQALRGTTQETAVFGVDFAAKTIEGSVNTTDTEFGSLVSMQGNISGGSFSGTAESGGESGVFNGQFNGSAAQELGGIAQFTDSSKDIAFGASHQ